MLRSVDSGTRLRRIELVAERKFYAISGLEENHQVLWSQLNELLGMSPSLSNVTVGINILWSDDYTGGFDMEEKQVRAVLDSCSREGCIEFRAIYREISLSNGTCCDSTVSFRLSSC